MYVYVYVYVYFLYGLCVTDITLTRTTTLVPPTCVSTHLSTAYRPHILLSLWLLILLSCTSLHMSHTCWPHMHAHSSDHPCTCHTHAGPLLTHQTIHALVYKTHTQSHSVVLTPTCPTYISSYNILVNAEGETTASRATVKSQIRQPELGQRNRSLFAVIILYFWKIVSKWHVYFKIGGFG